MLLAWSSWQSFPLLDRFDIALFFLTYVIQDRISFILSSVSFNWVAILSCVLWSLFIHNPGTPSFLGAFQFGILLHYFFNLSSLITSFCCSNFTISSFKLPKSRNHSASIYFVLPLHIFHSKMSYFLYYSVCHRYYFLYVLWTCCKLSFDPSWTILHCWVLCLYWDILAAFASVFCFSYPITIVKLFFFLDQFSLTFLACTSLPFLYPFETLSSSHLHNFRDLIDLLPKHLHFW